MLTTAATCFWVSVAVMLLWLGAYQFGVCVRACVWKSCYMSVFVWVCVCVLAGRSNRVFWGGDRHEREAAVSVFDVQWEQSAERLPALYQQRNTLPIVWEEEGARRCVLMCLFVCDLINRRTPKGPAQSASVSLRDWLLSVSKRGCICVCIWISFL